MEYCFGGSPIWMWKRESGGACQVQTPLLQAHLEQNHHINCQLMCLHAARINPWEKSAGPGHAVSRRGVVFFCWRSSGRRCGAKCGGEGGSSSWKQAAESRLWVGFFFFFQNQLSLLLLWLLLLCTWIHQAVTALWTHYSTQTYCWF